MYIIGLLLAIIGGMGIGLSSLKATICFYVMLIGLYLMGFRVS